MYGQELKYTKLCNWKEKLIFAMAGETYPGHLIRFFVNRQYLDKYKRQGHLSILEIGSYNGAFAFWLSRQKNYCIDAIDNDQNFINDCEAIRNKLRRNNINFILADAADKLPLYKKYDWIFSSHVLEHIEDDRRVLANVFEYLKPGGYFILQVPYSCPGRLPPGKYSNSSHVRGGYTKLDLYNKLEEAGFTIVSMTGSVGKIGRFAYVIGRFLFGIKIIVNLYILFFPVIFLLIYLEQISSFLRRQELDFKHSPLVITQRLER